MGIRTSGTMYDSGDFNADFSLKNTDDLNEGSSNLYFSDARVNANSNVSANTTHSSSNGSNHSDVVLNTSHRSLANEHIDWTGATDDFETSGRLNVIKDSATGTPSFGANVVAVFMNTASTGQGTEITIISGNNSTGKINFGDPQNEDQGEIVYNQGNSTFQWNVGAGTPEMVLGFAGLGIGRPPPSTILGQLHVDQAGSASAKPVLYLDQADVSEEILEIVSSIGVGNAIEAVGAKTLTTTHFIKITLTGGLTRYLPVGTIA